MTTSEQQSARLWYKANVKKPQELDEKITATLDYVQRFMEPDIEGDWNVFAYEIVDGHHGQHTVKIFIEEITATAYEELGMDDRMELFDSLSKEVARVFKQNSKLDGKFHVGHNEADGSLGVFYSVRAS